MYASTILSPFIICVVATKIVSLHTATQNNNYSRERNSKPVA